MENGSQYRAEESFASLLGGIAYDAKELLLQEVALTKRELQYELHKAKTATIALGSAIGIIATGGILLMLALVHLLDAFTVVPLWGCYGIVATILVVLGAVLLVAAKTKAEALEVVPQPTVVRMKENARWLTKQTTSDKS